jgi:hypothetical protein
MNIFEGSLRFHKSELFAHGSQQICWAYDSAKDEGRLSASVKIVQQRVNQRCFPCSYFSGQDYKTLSGSDSVRKLRQPFAMARAEVKETGIGGDIKRGLGETKMGLI